MTFVLALLVFMAIVAAMAGGGSFGGAAPPWFCGGAGGGGTVRGCEICGGDPDRCGSTMQTAPVRQYDADQDGR